MDEIKKTTKTKFKDKLKTFSKKVFDAISPHHIKELLDKPVQATVEAVINKACKIINEKLHKMYKNTIINSLITLGLNIFGMAIVLLNPFGVVASKYIAAAFFLSAIIFFWVRQIQHIKKYGKETVEVTKSIVTKRSISKGIENYVYTRFPAISLAYTEIEIAANFLPSLRKIPSLDKTIKYFIQTFWKKLAVYASVVAVYSISVYWIAKPFLLRNIAGLRWYEIYFYPIYHTISLFNLASK